MSNRRVGVRESGNVYAGCHGGARLDGLILTISLTSGSPKTAQLRTRIYARKVPEFLDLRLHAVPCTFHALRTVVASNDRNTSQRRGAQRKTMDSMH